MLAGGVAWTIVAACFIAPPGPSSPPSCAPLHGRYPIMPIPAATCCKVCHKGKACGDTCIARDRACHVGAGCACDG
jgi:hypothetical protein